MAGKIKDKKEGLLIFDYDTFIPNYNKNSIINTLLMSKAVNMNCIIFGSSVDFLEERTLNRIDYYIVSEISSPKLIGKNISSLN